MDIVTLRRANSPVSTDLDAFIAARRGRLSQCADPIRTFVRQREPGHERARVVVRVVGVRGLPIDVRSVTVEPRLGTSFDECVMSALSDDVATPRASGDYAAIDVRLHLCIDPKTGEHEAS
ncbi:MAG TPA: hypothetical protein VN253_29655 [Kofleriaceae bacterium]|nr:hypothetical protein [Kofleriaceae bacterium]